MAYEPINWIDLPSEETPIDADNLNHMDAQIKANADALGYEQKVHLLANWMNGSLNTDGSVNPSTSWRLTTRDKISYVESKTLYFESGYRGQIALFNADGSLIKREACLDGYVLPINSIFRLSVYKTNEATQDSTVGYEDKVKISLNVSSEIDKSNAKIGEISKNSQMLSDEWNSTTTYAQGDFAIYKNKLWKSKVASNLNHAPEEGSYWTETSVGDEIKINEFYLSANRTNTITSSNGYDTLIIRGQLGGSSIFDVIAIHNTPSIKHLGAYTGITIEAVNINSIKVITPSYVTAKVSSVLGKLTVS